MSISYRVKKKKRNPHDRRITLDAHHHKKMDEFDQLHDNLQAMKEELTFLKEKKDEIEKSHEGMSILNARVGKQLYQINQRFQDLKKQIRDIESGRMEDDYYAKTAHLLFQYYDNIRVVAQQPDITAPAVKKRSVMDFFAKPPPTQAPAIAPSDHIPLRSEKNFSSTRISDFVDTTKRSRQANLLERYTKIVNPEKYQSIKFEKRDIDICPSCACEMSLIQSEGVIVCNQCGREEPIIVDSEKPSYKDPPPEAGEFTYKRINRLEEWLTQYQAKETTEIPQEVLDKILMEIKKERIQNMACLTIEKVRKYLKKLKLNKYYEHIPHIIYCLNGLPTPRFRRDLEDKLRLMFREIQEIFDKVCPAQRTNFLSYSYLLAKLLELLGEDEHKNYFRLHKSREKIYQHDQVWRKICTLLRWQYIRTV